MPRLPGSRHTRPNPIQRTPSTNGQLLQSRAAARLFKHLADPYKMSIVMLLADGELNNGQLASLLGVSPSRISMQITFLRLAQIIHTRKDGRTAINSLTTLGLRLQQAVEELRR